MMFYIRLGSPVWHLPSDVRAMSSIKRGKEKSNGAIQLVISHPDYQFRSLLSVDHLPQL